MKYLEELKHFEAIGPKYLNDQGKDRFIFLLESERKIKLMKVGK